MTGLSFSDPVRADASLPVWRRFTARQAIVLVGVVVIACVLAIAAGFILHLRAAAFDNSQREMRHLAVVLAEQTARAMQSVELVLASVEESLKRRDAAHWDGRAVHLMLADKSAGVPQIKQIAIVDAQGVVINSSRFYPAKRFSATDRSYFIMHRDSPSRDLIVSEPVLSRVGQDWLIIVSRRLDAPDGSFAGVMSVGLDPAYFEAVYREASGGDGRTIVLFRDDGLRLARYPALDGAIGAKVTNPVFSKFLASGTPDTTYRLVSRIDGQARLFAQHRVPGYPLVVTASIAETRILAMWWHEALLISLSVVFAAAAIAGLMIALRRHETRTSHQAMELAALVEKLDAARIEAEAAHAGLQRQTEIFSTLIRNLPVGVNLVDHDGCFMAFNRPFLELFDLPPERFGVGDTFEDFIRYLAEHDDVPGVDIEAAVRERVGRALDPAADQFERVRPSGRVVEVRRVALPSGGFVSTYIDVTEARRREADLEDARARLERHTAELVATAHKLDAANAAKSLFLANMSHELRTPLNAILGFSEVMRDGVVGALNAKYRGYARDIHASGSYLLRLINDILDTSKIEVGQLSLQDSPIDLAELLTECERLLLDKARAGGVSLITGLAPSLPSIRADRLRMKQILLNLLSNAIKFTPPGGQVRVSVAEPTEGGIAIVIADTGIGMKPESIPLALEPFRQLDSSFARRFEGTGLGLPLAKSLIELHGGRLEIESEPDKGTVVRVVLAADRVIQPPATDGGCAPDRRRRRA
ncbi:MAG TPA: PAS-domain containing protein [Alphaproteobacteria bacterium]